ncbi:hypothetical protein MSPP1_000168 [Malassezia sp. CBS 17886]|nr:hypothetical protein MSPP1_000168 [Malassezia sp. CBS 17886]
MTWFTSIAALSGATSVIFGAFGAHALKDKVSPHQAASWSTATHYQLAHSIVLLYASTSGVPLTGATLFASYAFTTGITLFSGSIYALCLLPAGHPARKGLGPVTPLGGLSLIIGWLALAYAKRPTALRLAYSFSKYASLAARATRQALKETERVAAERRAQEGLRYQTWKDGKASEQINLGHK